MSLLDAWATAREAANLRFGIDRLSPVRAKKVKCFTLPAVNQEKLDEDLKTFWSNWSTLPLLSFDTESSLETGNLVYVVLANFAGDVLIFNVSQLFYSYNLSLFDALGPPFDEIMRSSILVGSSIGGDRSKTATFLGCQLTEKFIDTLDVAATFGHKLWPETYKNRPG